MRRQSLVNTSRSVKPGQRNKEKIKASINHVFISFIDSGLSLGERPRILRNVNLGRVLNSDFGYSYG